MVPQDVETDRAIRVDVRVVNLGREADLGGFEGVVCGERDRQEEDAAGVRRVTLKSQHESHEPLKERIRLTGPIIVACHWNMLSPVGPALHDEGGSRPRSINS